MDTKEEALIKAILHLIEVEEDCLKSSNTLTGQELSIALSVCENIKERINGTVLYLTADCLRSLEDRLPAKSIPGINK